MVRSPVSSDGSSSQAGHDAVGIVRKPEHVPDLQADGVTPAMIDLEDTERRRR